MYNTYIPRSLLAEQPSQPGSLAAAAAAPGPRCGTSSGIGTGGKVSWFPSPKGRIPVEPTSKRTTCIRRAAEKTIAAILTWGEQMIADLIVVS